jgi:hypothetical protein
MQRVKDQGRLNRREFSAAMAAGLTVSASAGLGVSKAFAADTVLPILTSLPKAAASAKAKGEPLVVLVSLPGCPYCEIVRRNYLLPGRRDAGLQAWQIDTTDSKTPLLGFDGMSTTAAAQAKAWKVKFTPTVLFLGPEGQELAERLVGAGIPDFYGAYLGERLESSRKALDRL